ncbi:MAG: DMT family transporter, partial [Rhodobacteraceae bacterium]|nr:DMT family transporter [Paracoccaceae bacterium]
MSNAVLFIVTVLVWGTSWIAITWQIGPVPVIVSVFYRILLAAILLLVGLAMTGRLALPNRWRFVVLQALCLFSLNFVALYNAAALIPSGLVSVIFSLASIFNAVNAYIFYGERITGRVGIAALIGVTGLVLLFWQSFAVSLDYETLLGVGWAMLGTLIFSLGNMASRQNSSLGITPVTANAWGMGIGAAILFAIVAISHLPLTIPTDTTYLLALTYLAVFASIVGFTTYLLLVARVGSAQAGYATVIFPGVALMASTLFEGFQWTPIAIAGV